LHIIATVRGKDEYVMEEKNGKQVPKKVGKGYKQRDNTEYNYTVTFNIDQQNHVAEATKDNTHLFENRYEVLTEKDGQNLYDWANSGDTPAPKPAKKEEKTEELSSEERLTNGIKMIEELVTKLKENGVEKESIVKVIKDKHEVKGKPSANYNSIKDVEVATNVYKALKELEVK